jgi:hypothetical protein
MAPYRLHTPKYAQRENTMAVKRSRGMRKVPPFIEAKLSSIGNQFFVAAVKRVAVDDVKNGLYDHVGLSWRDGQLEVNPPAAPPASQGRYARFNLKGREIVRRDLPKVLKRISFTNTCLFGRPGNIAHITQTRQVYQRQHVPAQLQSIEPTVLRANDEICIVRFNIQRQFSSLAADADRELLFALNLLHESVGDVNVFATNATTQEYLGSIHVHWEILPAGQRESNISLILSSCRPKSQEQRDALEDLIKARYGFLETLNPKHLIRGTGGMGGYLGAMIQDDKVVFDHLTPGNGVYVMFADWAAQSQRTKTDLLMNAQEGKDYIRIFHTGDWQDRVRNAIAA